MADIDHTVLTEDGCSIYESYIYSAFDQYCNSKEYTEEDIINMSQSRWLFILINIYNTVFKDNKDLLKVNGNINNQYDVLKVNEVLDIYISLCCEYDKIVYQSDFLKLTGISREIISYWDRGNEKLGSLGSDIHKKLAVENEKSLERAMNTGRRNPMCYMPSLNHRYGWNMPGTQNGEAKEKVKSIAEIQQKHGIKQISSTDTTTADKPPDAEF